VWHTQQVHISVAHVGAAASPHPSPHTLRTTRTMATSNSGWSLVWNRSPGAAVVKADVHANSAAAVAVSVPATALWWSGRAHLCAGPRPGVGPWGHRSIQRAYQPPPPWPAQGPWRPAHTLPPPKRPPSVVRHSGGGGGGGGGGGWVGGWGGGKYREEPRCRTWMASGKDGRCATGSVLKLRSTSASRSRRPLSASNDAGSASISVACVTHRRP
jgi:hypothetical protein